MPYRIRNGTINDGVAVAKLFAAGGNVHRWSEAKYLHYYRDYPEGEPYTLVAESANGEVVGFYALLPVRISSLHGYMQLHVMVEPTFRRYPIASIFLDRGIEYAKSRGADLIVAFSNRQFSMVLSRLFKWKLLGYLKFVDVEQLNRADYAERLQFVYGDAWYRWKFGDQCKDVYVQQYMKGDCVCNQLLKVRQEMDVAATSLGLSSLNAWAPEGYSLQDPSGWTQTVTVKALNPQVSERVYDISKWYFEMGDSDTFEYDLIERISNENNAC